MNTNNKISEEQLKTVLEEHPEFAEKLAVQNQVKEASTNPVKSFKSFSEANKVFNFLFPKESEQTEVEDPKMDKFGSGTIKENTQYFPYLTGKNSIALPLSKHLAPKALKNNSSGVFTYEDIFYILRIFIALERNGTLETVAHVSNNDMVSAGKHKLHVFNLEDIIKDNPIKAKIYVNACPDNKYIKYDISCEDDDTKIWLIPLVVSADKHNEIISSIEDTWLKKKDDFISKLVKGYSEEDASTIRKALDTVISSNIRHYRDFDCDVGFSKGAALYYLDNNQVSPLQDAITENTKDADYLNIVSNLYPKYGEELIDESDIIYDDEHKIPMLSKTDVDYLKIVGITKELINTMYTASIQSLDSAKIVVDSTEINNVVTEASNAECRLIVDLDNDNWKSVMDSVYDSEKSDYQLMSEKLKFDKSVSDAEQTVYEITQQFAVLQKTAKRIELKVKSGEFTNVYMTLCNDCFYKMYKNQLNIDDKDFFNYSTFPMYIDLMNKELENEYVVDKIRQTILNTMKCDVSKDKFGNPVDNLFDKFANEIKNFVEFDAIPANLGEDEFLKQLMDQVFTRFRYIDNVSKLAYKYLLKLNPEYGAIYSNNQAENIAELSSKYFTELGLDKADMNIEVNKDMLNIFKNANLRYIENFKKNISDIKKKYLDYLNKLNETKSKNRLDKSKTFAKFAIYFTLYAYIESVDTGMMPLDESPSEEELKKDIYLIKDSKTDKDISKEDYLGLDDIKRKNYTVFKKLSDNDIDDLIADYTLRITYLSSFIVLFTRILMNYEKFDNVDVENFSGKMLVTELGLFVPSIAVLEYPNFTSEESKNNTVSFDEIIPVDSKIKLGTSAVNKVIDGLDNPENLIRARKHYLESAEKYCDKVLTILSDCE